MDTQTLQAVQGYEEVCRRTARFPKIMAIPYLALGLCGEADELTEAQTQIDYYAELGDSQWYVCSLAAEYGFGFAGIVTEAMLEYEGIGKSMPYRDAARNAAKELVSNACKIAELVKKYVRDKDIWDEKQTAAHHSKIRRMLVKHVTISMAAILDPDISYTDILAGNADKLLSRLERGTLQGSGDNR